MSWDTTWNMLGWPRPRTKPLTYSPYAWRGQDCVALPPPDEASSTVAALGARRSRRAFGPLGVDALATLLASVGACKERIDSPLGFPLERRGVPSGGAIHPVHLLVCDPGTRVLHRYDGDRHGLLQLAERAPSELVTECSEVLDLQRGTLLFFVAEPGKTAAKYEDPITVIWRDAGVLQGVLAVVAEAIGLNFCLLGLTGDPWLAGLSQQGKLRGVGAALVGSRP